MSSRGLAILALLLVASGAERFAYHGLTVFSVLDARGGGTSLRVADIGSAIALQKWAGIPALFLGAALVLAIGARWTAALGALVCAIANAMLASGVPLAYGGAFWALGAGMLQICPFVAAAEVLGTEAGSTDAPSPGRCAAVAAFTIAVTAATNVAASAASAVTLRVHDVFGRAGVFAVLGVSTLLATLLAGGAGLVRPGASTAEPTQPRDPYRTPAVLGARSGASRATSSPNAALGAVALLLVPATLYTAAWTLVSASVRQPAMELAVSHAPWLFALEAGLTTLARIFLFVALLAMALTRASLPPLVLFGVGLGVTGLAAVIGAAADAVSRAFFLGVFAVGLSALGRAAAPIGIAYAALAIRGRRAGFVVAGWFAALTVTNEIVIPLMTLLVGTRPPERSIAQLLVGLVATAAGIGTAALARRIQRD